MTTPPTAKIVPHTFEHLSRSFVDNYFWLQDKNDPEVIAHLEAENAYAKESLQHTKALQETLFEEMKGRIKEDDSSVPQKNGDYFYYYRMEAGKQYRIFCRKQGSLDAPEQILVDENQLAESLEYCRLFIFEPSPDHRLLAYSVDVTGSLVFNLYVMDMQTGQTLVGPIANTAWEIAWASDNQTVFYTIFDAAHRSYQMRRLTLGGETDTLIYHESDEAFQIGVRRTRSGAYLLMTIASQMTSEVHVLNADTPAGKFQLVHPRQSQMEYYLEHHGDQFFIRTNEAAENFKLMQAPVANPSKENWRTVVPHRADALIEDVEAFRDYLVIRGRKAGLPQIWIAAPENPADAREAKFPEPVYTFHLDSNPEFDSTALRIVYSSLVTPESTVDYGLADGAWDVKKRREIPSGYDPSQYVSERLFAIAPDGTQIPISLVYRKDARKHPSPPAPLPQGARGENVDAGDTHQDRSSPLLLYGYGSYGYSMDASFNPNRLSLLDRGFIFAIAHIRGGSELGRSWYEQGRLLNKKNSFTDFIACAEHLIQNGYTSSEKLAIMGGSAGGLLMSAVVNLRPELFKAVVAQVAFTNVITAMLMPELPLTVIEYEQWGNPSDPQAFEYMLSYSPYNKIEAKAYPHIFATAGLNDLQVPYWDPAKWVANLRAHKTDDNRLLLVTNMGAGHGGASGRYNYLVEIAEIYAFLVDAVGG